jgi:uncharacterized protein YukE
MGDIDESKLQAAIDALHASATTFSNASHTVQSRAQHLFGISLDITYNVHDWAGAGSEAFQHAWGQFDQDSRKAVNALSGTANALNKLAQKLQDALDAKRQAERNQGLMILGTIGLGILDVAQLGLDPVTDAATVGMAAGAVAEGAVDIAGMVAEADVAAEAELAGIETTEVGTLETVDEGALDFSADEEMPAGGGGDGGGPRGPDEPGGGGGGGNDGEGGDGSDDSSNSGGDPSSYPDPNNLENPTARNYATKMENSLRDHLKPSDLEGAWRDLHGDPVPKAGNPGEYYQHLNEVNDGLRSLRNVTQKFTELLKDPSLSTSDQSIIQSFLSRASKTMDYVEKILGRDQWFPGTRIP